MALRRVPVGVGGHAHRGAQSFVRLLRPKALAAVSQLGFYFGLWTRMAM